MTFKTGLFSTILLGAMACESTTPSTNTTPSLGPTPVEQANLDEMPPAPVDVPPEEIVPSEERSDANEPASLAAAGNLLAFDLYKTQAGKPGNLAFSPASISLAFAMTYAGANGPTAEEMKKVLHLPSDKVLYPSATKLLASWKAENKEYKLNVVNRLFGEAEYKFEPTFLDITKNNFQAPMEPVDFKEKPEAQRVHINNWVLDQTEKRIANLLPKKSIDKKTRLVLVNAIYFLGKWEKAFRKNNTQRKPFFVNGTAKSKVPTMHQTSYFSFAKVKDAKIMQMPYKGGDLAMTLILPDAKDGLSKLEAEISAERYQEWKTELRGQKVNVAMPSFKIANAALPLKVALKALGMNLAFDEGKADFTKMGKPSEGNENEALFITDAFHKAFVQVDESGTEAAAATAVVVGAKTTSIPRKPMDFTADHPFLFTIEDTESGALLFVGRVVDPR